VNWHFEVKNISDKTFELHLTAKIERPWHIYAQDSPENISFPTTIHFGQNPLIDFVGKAKELGDLIEKKENGLFLKYYFDHVDFVQLLKLKSNVKTNISGVIEFMPCTDLHCLPPSSRRFNLTMNAQK